MRPRITERVLRAVLWAVVALVGWVEGFSNPLAAWNCAPVLLALYVVRPATMSGPAVSSLRRRAARWGFSLFTALTVAAVHLLWLFDWRGTATGSSTSGLVFLFLPFLSLAAGSVGFVLTWAAGRHVPKLRR